MLDEGGNDEATNRETFGLLYNWYAVDAGLCPTGWHDPTKAEFEAIIDANGGSTAAGEAMKSSATDTPAWNGTNTTGFSALKGGRRTNTGAYPYTVVKGYYWTATNGGAYAKFVRIKDETNDADIPEQSKTMGFSARCVKDANDSADTTGDDTTFGGTSGDTSDSGDTTSGDTTSGTASGDGPCNPPTPGCPRYGYGMCTNPTYFDQASCEANGHAWF